MELLVSSSSPIPLTCWTIPVRRLLIMIQEFYLHIPLLPQETCTPEPVIQYNRGTSGRTLSCEVEGTRFSATKLLLCPVNPSG